MAAESVALLFQGKGTPHFLRHGSGHCSLRSLWDRNAHVEAWDVHGATHADSPGHVGHTTYLETLLGNIHTHGNTGHVLTHRSSCSDILVFHLAVFAYCSSPGLKSFPLFSKTKLAFGFDIKKNLRPASFIDTATLLPAFGNLLWAWLGVCRVGEHLAQGDAEAPPGGSISQLQLRSPFLTPELPKASFLLLQS